MFGSLVVLGLFVTLAYAGIRIATRSKEPFVRYASAGIVVWLLSQAVINLGHGARPAPRDRDPAAR